MQIYKPSWHKIVSDNLLAIISKYFAVFSNVQIEVIYQLQCVCCPICKPLTVKIFQFTIHCLHKKTLSVSPQSLDFIPQTSLPYIKIGFINVSKRLSIRSGGSSPIAFILGFILNMAFLARSHKNWYVFFSASWLGDFIELMMLPRYL